MVKYKTIGVIGGGIVGLAAALKVSEALPDAMLILFEKESAVALHQSGNNSGVLHCGLYYAPGSLKAKFAVQGIQEMIQFCIHHQIPHEICGKLVVAINSDEVARLRTLEERGRQNGVSGIRRLNSDEIREREPHAAGIEALEVPQEGIVDYPKVCRKLQDLLQEQGHQIILNCRVSSGGSKNGKICLNTDNGDYELDYVINCAGLQSDLVCKNLGGSTKTKIIPFRGEYYKLKPESTNLVKHLIYPVPDPKFPFLGVHFTRLIEGGVEAGPNAVLALSREGYHRRSVSLKDMADSIFFPGFWKFIANNGEMCVSEFLQSFSKKRFCDNLRKLVPAIQEADLVGGGAGVRAQAMLPSGSLVDDFDIVESERMLHLINAPSPAATASLAIGAEIARRVALN